MIKFIASIALILLMVGGYAQINTAPAHERIPTIPAFNLAVAPDSSVFTKENLKRKKATIIMVFSPDCDHCIHATEDLIANYASFKNVQIIMGSSMGYKEVKAFTELQKLSSYPTITAGYDRTGFFNSFYNVMSYPAVFLYDKKGKFKKAFNSSVKFSEVAKEL